MEPPTRFLTKLPPLYGGEGDAKANIKKHPGAAAYYGASPAQHAAVVSENRTLPPCLGVGGGPYMEVGTIMGSFWVALFHAASMNVHLYL